jgi:hypothetical protein
MMSESVKISFHGIRKFATVIENDLRLRGNGPIRVALKRWGVMYQSAMHERFDRFSKGGGTWPGLKESTKKRRAKAREGATGPRVFTILRDTNSTMMKALDPQFQGKPGELSADTPFGVRVGFGGPAQHPKGRATIADIAAFHHFGRGNLPARPILVVPDAMVLAEMSKVMGSAVRVLAKQCEVKT